MFPTAPSDWHLYTLEPSPDGPSTGPMEQDETDADIDADNCADADADAGNDASIDAGSDTNMQQLDLATHPALSPETSTTNNSPSSPDSPPPTNSCSTAPTKVPTHVAPVNRGQDNPDLEPPTRPDCGVSPCGNNLLTTIDDLPMTVTESTWMKAKKTLKYFREVHKMGKLSTLILHWYQLEEALGFQETVSCPAT